ncbi:hypothetical protein ACQP1G_19865 [Nocardia sp. CA-107356]|uniref:WXG100-like domain-containing protein n=1 Tax=Nocardia sp. CA-107356 TaxID=3239972 RepID=UPI003D8E97FA
MAIEIPHEVATFLNYVGVPYPDVNEDHVHALADHVRVFSSNVQRTYESASTAIEDLGSVYSGYSYEQLVTAWARMGPDHMSVLDAACIVVGSALDAVADVIEAVKIAVLAELAGLAVGYFALIGAAIATGGIATVMERAVVTAAHKLCEAMQQMLVDYIISEVAEKTVALLEHTIERLVHAAADAAASTFQVPLPSGANVSSLRINSDAVRRYSKLFDQYADNILKCSQDFADNASRLDFITPGAPSTTETLDALLPRGIPSARTGPAADDGRPTLAPAQPAGSDTTKKVTAPGALDPSITSGSPKTSVATTHNSSPVERGEGPSLPATAAASGEAKALPNPIAGVATPASVESDSAIHKVHAEDQPQHAAQVSDSWRHTAGLAEDPRTAEPVAELSETGDSQSTVTDACARTDCRDPLQGWVAARSLLSTEQSALEQSPALGHSRTG